MVELVGKSELW